MPVLIVLIMEQELISKLLFKMKKYEEKAIPLIIRKASKVYEANPEALEFLSSLSGKVAVISVAGMYRTGKSFLLNTMLLNKKKGFDVGPTTNPKTKGIWVWAKPLIFKNQLDEIINVIVLDSEGLGSTQQDINHDLRLFSITLLLSSAFLYNTIGAIDENAIDSLGLVLRLCEHLKAENYNDFPDFYWILRDFSLALVGKDNNPLTTKMYLQNCLSPQPGDSEDRNRIRDIIRSSFTTRNCSTFVRPLTDQSCLQNLDQMELNQLRPEFVEQVLEFRKNIFGGLKNKKIKGKEIKGEMLCDLVKIYVQQINGKKLPVIESGWLYVCQKQCEGAMDLVEKELTDKLAALEHHIPQTKKGLREQQQKIANELRGFFLNKTAGNDQAEKFMPQISKMIQKKFKRIEEEMKTKNSQQTKNFIRKQFEIIQKKLKHSEFKNMGELVKEFEIFYEYYRKNCPYKDEIQTGLEYIMKKFSDCSLILYKSIKTKKEAENQKLREEIEKLTNEFVAKEEKYRQDKVLYTDKQAILETKIDELTAQNQEMNRRIAQLESELDKVRLDFEEKTQKKCQQLEMESICLKKQLLECESVFKSLQTEKNQELNNVRKELLLKENQISHFLEEKQISAKKLTDLSEASKSDNNETKKIITTLTNQIKTLESKIEDTVKNSQKLVTQKENSLGKLQNCLEAKSSQFQKAEKSYKDQVEKLIDSWKSQKDSIEEEHNHQINKLNDILKEKQEQLNQTIKNFQNDHSEKQSGFKTQKMQIEKQKAILNQKIDFLKKDCEEKENKIVKLTEESVCFMEVFEQKDNDIQQLIKEIEEIKQAHHQETQSLTTKFNELDQIRDLKIKEAENFQQQVEKLEEEVRKKGYECQQKSEEIETAKSQTEQKIRELTQKLNYEIECRQQSGKEHEAEIDKINQQNTRSNETQKRNAQLSLVQLKNCYEMEKQRLEKRILEDRKKHQYNESNALLELENKHRKQQKAKQEEIAQLKSAIEDLEEHIGRTENQFEMRVINTEEECENERRLLTSKYQVLQKKYEEISEQYASLERVNEEERITFIKKIEALNFEVSRKEKDNSQLQSKKESFEAAISKKDSQIENVKRMMNQEIETSLRKVSEIQNKYQKLNEEYMEMKIEFEKEIALCKQRNQFLTAKVQELTKEREIGSMKNIEKIDRQKISDLKDQLQKHKAEQMSLQMKLESNRKCMKEAETNAKKQILKLEKDNQFYLQKNEMLESKCCDLESKISAKNELFTKETDESRQKSQKERSQLHKEIQVLREKLSAVEDEKNQISWKMQKEVALINERMKYAEYQRDQLKKEVEENEKRLQLTVSQLRRNTEKVSEENQNRKNNLDKKFSIQIETMKETMKNRNQDQEDTVKRLKEQARGSKDKIIELNERLNKAEKIKQHEKLLQEENEQLKREKETIYINNRNDRIKENDEWKKKLYDTEKKCKQTERKNNQFMFLLEKQQTKWMMEKEQLRERIKNLEDSLEWEKNKAQLAKSKTESKKTGSTNYQL